MKMNKTQINGTINISKKSRGTNSQPSDEWNKKNPATGYLEMREPNEKMKHFNRSNQISKLRFKIYYQKKKKNLQWHWIAQIFLPGGSKNCIHVIFPTIQVSSKSWTSKAFEITGWTKSRWSMASGTEDQVKIKSIQIMDS